MTNWQTLSATLNQCLDYILPNVCIHCQAYCDMPLCKTCTKSFTLTPLTTATPTTNTPITSLYTFTGPIKEAFHVLKFDRMPRVATQLVPYLSDFSPQTDLVIPVPIHKQRERTRGYNQLDLLFGHLHTYAPIVTRHKNTPKLFELSAEKRKHIMHDVFSVTTPQSITNKTITIVDDIYTTGTTLESMIATLKPYNPASITCFTICHG